MPRINFAQDVCPHDGEHMIWVGSRKRTAVCLMAPQYLNRCIGMLRRSINSIKRRSFRSLDDLAALTRDQVLLDELLREKRSRE